MKLIVAYIQPHKLNDVKQALMKAEVGKMSVTNALGCGAQQGYEESYRGIKFEVPIRPTSGPDSRTMPMPPRPGGVARATMVSSTMDILRKQSANRVPP